MFNKLHPGTPFPKDQMDLAPIRDLLKEDLIKALKEHPEEGPQKLGEYLRHLRLFDQATTDNAMENEKRFNDLDLVVKYFETWEGPTSGLRHQLATTVGSLKAVYYLCKG